MSRKQPSPKDAIGSFDLTRVTVEGLHGSSKTISAHIVDNKLILVGENGSGKTTFLRIVFNLLAGRLLPLSQTRFTKAVVEINNESVEIKYADIEKDSELFDKRLLRELPHSARRSIQSILESGANLSDPGILQRITDRHGIPFHYLIDQLSLFDDDVRSKNSKTYAAFRKIRSLINAQILYLPTFRRIERELTSILEGYDPDEIQRRRQNRRNPDTSRSFVELVEFGMRDVEDAIDQNMSNLREFQRTSLSTLTLQYLGDIVGGKYQNAETDQFQQATQEDVASVLARMDESIVPENQRKVWIDAINEAKSKEEPNEHDKIIRHYFQKLLAFQKELRDREKNVVAFCEICNNYMTNKQFLYESGEFTVKIIQKGMQREDDIRLRDLSSGEKQVVSLFSHLYLSGSTEYFVLIDEPELSLSVPWQQRFLLDIANAQFCKGLIAVTHSPFIYDNELKKYAHALGEFIEV